MQSHELMFIRCEHIHSRKRGMQELAGSNQVTYVALRAEQILTRPLVNLALWWSQHRCLSVKLDQLMLGQTLVGVEIGRAVPAQIQLTAGAELDCSLTV